jgi:beta-hydroxyacyl-ACP dehydratase FabZ
MRPWLQWMRTAVRAAWLGALVLMLWSCLSADVDAFLVKPAYAPATTVNSRLHGHPFARSAGARTQPLRCATGPATPAHDFSDAKTLSMVDADLKTVMTNEQIAKVLPHRYPFLLVDKVVEFEPGKRIVGIKCITANEPQFTGHFPDRPIMPGVMQIEAMAQLGGLLCLQAPVTTGEGQRIFFFTGVEGVRFVPHKLYFYAFYT